MQILSSILTTLVRFVLTFRVPLITIVLGYFVEKVVS
jgi:hypothetical protein